MNKFTSLLVTLSLLLGGVAMAADPAPAPDAEEVIQVVEEIVKADPAAEEAKAKQKEIATIQLQIRLLQARLKAKTVEWELERQLRQSQHTIKLDRIKADLFDEKAFVKDLKLTKEVQAIQKEMELRKLHLSWKLEVNKMFKQTKTPFKDGVLTISDRRIPLNGPIIRGTAKWITDRIHFYNNKSDYPIFIVIDTCPGGSVMEGYRILKAMEASKAPVYVVVKSYAASMAAAITTLAEHSYAYPNAVILHHEISWGSSGSFTENEEVLELVKKWEARLSEPIAAKMGITAEELRKEMYKHNSNGDWEEFADEAKKLKWVNEVVGGIVEQSIVTKPKDAPPAPRMFFFQKELKEEIDSRGKPYVMLPRLNPFDVYHMHNPDYYYRVR